MGNLITQNLPPFKDLSISKLSPLSNREAVALYDFNSESPGTLCVGAGEKLEIVCEMHAWRVKEEGSGWVVVRSLSGAEGYVPKAFLNLYVENLELNDGNPGSNEAISLSTINRLMLFRAGVLSPGSFFNLLLPELQHLIELQIIELASYVEAKYDFLAEFEKELPLSEGDRLEVLWKTGEWWYALKEDGSHGYIPHNYVHKVDLR